VIVQLDTAIEALRDEEAEAAAKHIRGARELARESLTEARRSMHALRPQPLEKADFADALKAIITNTMAGTSLQSVFQLKGEPRKLQSSVEENLLHIGQEALTNALRHARATKFQARLSFDSDAVRLELRDNGKGFVVDCVNGRGIGLIGMKERAQQIGATLVVTSKPGKGTTIVAVSPYPAAVHDMKASGAKKKPGGTKKERIRVLIADDHAVVREGLVALVKRKSDMVIVAEASNGREAVDLWKQHRPHVTLLDLRMPELDGVGAIKEIREIDPNAHIVVLTTYDGDEDIYRAIKAGAKAYLLKDTARDALVDTVRRVHAGETYLPPQLAAKLAERVSGAALSQREMEVLQRMAAGKSNKEIGAQLFISDGTVKTHVKCIFTKLDVVSRTEKPSRPQPAAV
jgi:DNA-binding NarL/FixJ family response regulator/two-component sensor histidine kinase